MRHCTVEMYAMRVGWAWALQRVFPNAVISMINYISAYEYIEFGILISRWHTHLHVCSSGAPCESG